MNGTDSKVIVALDFPQQQQALDLVERLDPSLCRLKVGKEMFTRLGPQFVEQLSSRGYDIFLDLKFHDIPNTVAAACDAAADLGVWMMNLHASGGRRMMVAARERLEQRSQRPL
ncbi:MAG: orotidine-5'-phosphate decarboxylase, partial [Candidatus Thiodiazotropha taylori]|nr:orotidine-5'-phosphate decarboxylase [Candidatus Thiodiazotropha taylori]